ncbi:hypothetical protein I6A60_24845 [Frankia sp. AgB1.9]|uniref:hypothetical protein n=1 Tax=Frankia sp. AgB1.9 TaxID=1836968 RepID=UPI001932CB83|nr:hypothetical protein [Frankia sp. AgB1.9]MBL7551069.1 hypothetical protein [Frankia sp. AgB1.9]
MPEPLTGAAPGVDAPAPPPAEPDAAEPAADVFPLSLELPAPEPSSDGACVGAAHSPTPGVAPLTCVSR